MAKGKSAAVTPSRAPAGVDHLEGAKVTVLESGLGEMSAEDRAAILGAAGPVLDPAEPPETFAMTATEELARAGITPEISLAARVLTLEGQVADLTHGFEAWAKTMNERMAASPRAAQDAPVPVRPASKEEEAAYTRTNYALHQLDQQQYNGIQDWRDKGSPRLEPKPEEKKERAA